MFSKVCALEALGAMVVSLIHNISIRYRYSTGLGYCAVNHWLVKPFDCKLYIGIAAVLDSGHALHDRNLS